MEFPKYIPSDFIDVSKQLPPEVRKDIIPGSVAPSIQLAQPNRFLSRPHINGMCILSFALNGHTMRLQEMQHRQKGRSVIGDDTRQDGLLLLRLDLTLGPSFLGSKPPSKIDILKNRYPQGRVGPRKTLLYQSAHRLLKYLFTACLAKSL